MKFFFSNLLFERSSCTVCDLILHAVYYFSLVTGLRSSRVRAVHSACRNVIAYEIALITVSSRIRQNREQQYDTYGDLISRTSERSIPKPKIRIFATVGFIQKQNRTPIVIRTASINSSDNSSISRTMIFARVGFNFFFLSIDTTRVYRTKCDHCEHQKKNHSSSI